MFKKFDEKEGVTGVQQLKSSVQKGIRHRLVDDYPHIEPYMEDICPKKEGFKLIKCKDHIELITGNTGQLLFFKTRDGVYIPTLRLLHKYPFLLPHQQVDKGAIRFVLSGANIMCRGLTTPGGRLQEGLGKDKVVAVMAEGKTHAVAVGQMTLSTEDILKVNKGIGIDNLHYLNDGLWNMAPLK